jgi:hypothetical protein
MPTPPVAVKPPRPFSQKVLVIAAVTLVFAGVFWFCVSRLMAGGFSERTIVGSASLSAATLLAFSVVVGGVAVLGMVAPWRRERWGVAALIGILAQLFFPFSLTTFLAVLIFVLGMIFYVSIMAKEARSRIRFSFDKTIKVDMTPMIGLVLIAVSVLYYGAVSNQGSNPDKVLRDLTESTTNVLEGVLPVAYPQYESDLTVDQFIRRQLPDASRIIEELNLNASSSREAKRQLLEQKLRDLDIDPESVDVEAYLDDSARAQSDLEASLNKELVALQDEAVRATREQLAQNFRVTLRGDERLADAVDLIVTHNVDRLVRPHAAALPAILALSLFFFLWVFTFLYELVIRAVGHVVYLSLKAGGAVRIIKEPVEAERLSL